jgi:hypothetical protein
VEELQVVPWDASALGNELGRVVHPDGELPSTAASAALSCPAFKTRTQEVAPHWLLLALLHITIICTEAGNAGQSRQQKLPS